MALYWNYGFIVGCPDSSFRSLQRCRRKRGVFVRAPHQTCAVQHFSLRVFSSKKADTGNAGHVGAPMSGVVVEVRSKQGSEVKKGDILAVLSAMKMELVVSAPKAGKIESVSVAQGDSVSSGDLIATIST